MLREWVTQFLPRRGTIHTRDILANINEGRECVRSRAGTSRSHSAGERRMLGCTSFCPAPGWVPYDPTNTLVGGTDLIRVAFSRKPEQAAPVSGSWFGAAADFAGLDVRVSVRRVEPVGEPAGVV